MTPALVVGLLPAQAHRVRRALGGKYRFRFVQSEKAKHIRRTHAVTVVCLDYTDHAVSERLVKLLQPDQTLLRVRGLDKNVIAQLENHQCQPSI
jgi:hypothetical protein